MLKCLMGGVRHTGVFAPIQEQDLARWVMHIAGARVLGKWVNRVLLRKLTSTAKGEFILRLPKVLLRDLMIKKDNVIIHAVKRYLIIESADTRLRQLAEGRRLRNKRLVVTSKAT